LGVGQATPTANADARVLNPIGTRAKTMSPGQVSGNRLFKVCVWNLDKAEV
jgi:hypothetical protein